MENDAISRSAVLKEIDWAIDLAMDDEMHHAMCTLGERFKELPAIDVAPVVHAKWNEEDGTCSACHHEACYDEWTEPKWDYDWDENLVQTGEETHIQFIFSPYCPNCGARMDGEADGK